MPIEFYCSQCESKLRTADDTIGKGARCPNCGNIETVPPFSQESRALPSRELDSPPDVSLDKSQTSFGHRAESGPGNPFAAPSALPSPRDPVRFRGNAAIAHRKLLIPAIVLVVFSCIGLLFATLGLIGIVAEAAGNQLKGDDIGGLIVILLVVMAQGLVLMGAVAMLRLKGYGLAMTGAICAMLTGFGCCLPTGFGIWALVVLLDPDVKRFFS